MSDKVEMLDELGEIREQIDLMKPAAHKLGVMPELECVVDAVMDLIQSMTIDDEDDEGCDMPSYCETYDDEENLYEL